MTRAAAVLTLVLALVSTDAAAVSAGQRDGVPAGFVDGRPHEVRVRPVLGELPPAARWLSRAVRTRGEEAVASCDAMVVVALRWRVPTTPRSGDDPLACVVVPRAGGDEPKRLLLGPAYLTGSELGDIGVRRVEEGRRQVVARLSPRGTSIWQLVGVPVGMEPLAVTLDAEVIDVVPVTPDDGSDGEPAVVLGGRRGLAEREAAQLRDLLEQATHEEVIELSRQASMSRRARRIFAEAVPRIDEKTDFPDDCPSPEPERTLVLGCYNITTNEIFILRVDREELAGAMVVTAAHEMLHAAYEQLDDRERRRIDGMIADFLAATPNPRVEETLSEYSDDPRRRANEAHSLVGTEVRDLPPGLERYYGRYFDDRGAVVTWFESYRGIFDDLKAQYDRLVGELEALEVQLGALEGEIAAARGEATRLTAQIDELRRQGLIAESNALIGAQNAAADRANSLAAQYNGLVNEYNAKVGEVNAVAVTVTDLYNAISPIDAESPAQVGLSA